MFTKKQQKALNLLAATTQYVVTDGAEWAVSSAGKTPAEFFSRHFAGNWGNMPGEDIARNEDALADKGMLMSEYWLVSAPGQPIRKPVKIWVITDPGWAVTTLLLPSEY